MRTRYRTLSFLAAVLLLASLAGAQAAPVARVRYVRGAVQVMNLDNTAPPDQVLVNMPLPQGERLITGENGELEVQFEDGSVLRITPNSQAVLEDLGSSGSSSAQTSVSLVTGLFYLELRASDRGTYAVAAGDETIVPDENASFRVKIDEPPAEIGVLTGSVTVTRAGMFTAEVRSGESLRGDAKGTKRYFLTERIPEQSWDNWNETRAQAALDASNARTAVRDAYAGDTGYGWSDLDADGSWYSVPGEGMVWQPQGVDAGFDPYANGSFVNYAGPGYVFVSAYAWGWLPYRCGNWNWWGGFGWGWVPSANCGGSGFGFGYAGNGQWNLRHAPPRYAPPVWPRHPANPKDVVIHVKANPPKAVGSEVPAQTASMRERGPLQVGALVFTPLHPVGSTYTSRGRSAVGSALHMDFPVRPGTHEAVIGVEDRPRVQALPGQGGVQNTPQVGIFPLPRAGGALSTDPSQRARPSMPRANDAGVLPGAVRVQGSTVPVLPVVRPPMRTVAPIPVVAPPHTVAPMPVAMPPRMASPPTVMPQPRAAPVAAPVPRAVPSPDGPARPR